MTKYKSLMTKEIYDDVADAFDEVLQDMTWDDYERYFEEKFSFYQFFNMVKEMPGFYERFENEINDAENAIFEDTFEEIEVPDEE